MDTFLLGDVRHRREMAGAEIAVAFALFRNTAPVTAGGLASPTDPVLVYSVIGTQYWSAHDCAS
jgi:hypothetical protein